MANTDGLYMDYVSGSDANPGTKESPIKTTTGATSAKFGTLPKKVFIKKSPNPTLVGSATWTDGSLTVTIATAVTTTIENCEISWTAGTNVSAGRDSTQKKQGSYSARFTPSSSHNAAGILGYAPFIPSPLDLSGYTQVSFWFRNSVAIASAGLLQLKLYSDTACTIEVESFDLPAVPSTNQWLPITINKGSALSSSVQGVALYATAGLGSRQLYLDNIIACKSPTSDDSLSLQSLISKSNAAGWNSEGWYGIKSIVGTTIILDNDVNSQAGAGRGYSGTTETVNTYKRETIKTDLVSATTTVVQGTALSGTYLVNIEYLGGWNFDSDAQDGMTLFDGLNGMGFGFSNTSYEYIKMANLGYTRYFRGLNVSKGNSKYYNCSFSNAGGAGIDIENSGSVVSNLYFENIVANNNAIGIYFVILHSITGSGLYVLNNTTYSLYFQSCQIVDLSGIYSTNNANDGIEIFDSSNISLANLTTRLNAVSGIGTNSTVMLKSSVVNESTETAINASSYGVIVSHNHDNAAGNHWIIADSATINYTSAYQVDSKNTWKIMPTGTRRRSNFPVKFPDKNISQVSPFIADADSLVTVNVKLKKSHATNLVAKVVVSGVQTDGTAISQTATAPDDTNLNTVSITFTPTTKAEIYPEVWAYVADGVNSYTSYINVAEIEVTQA